MESSANIRSDGWEKMVNAEGYEYWRNRTTGSMSWTPPAATSLERIQQEEPSPWQRLYDEKQQRYYYYNTMTHESEWENEKQEGDILEPSHIELGGLEDEDENETSGDESSDSESDSHESANDSDDSDQDSDSDSNESSDSDSDSDQSNSEEEDEDEISEEEYERIMAKVDENSTPLEFIKDTGRWICGVIGGFGSVLTWVFREGHQSHKELLEAVGSVTGLRYSPVATEVLPVSSTTLHHRSRHKFDASGDRVIEA